MDGVLRLRPFHSLRAGRQLRRVLIHCNIKDDEQRALWEGGAKKKKKTDGLDG